MINTKNHLKLSPAQYHFAVQNGSLKHCSFHFVLIRQGKKCSVFGCSYGDRAVLFSIIFLQISHCFSKYYWVRWREIKVIFRGGWKSRGFVSRPSHAPLRAVLAGEIIYWYVCRHVSLRRALTWKCPQDVGSLSTQCWRCISSGKSPVCYSQQECYW